MNGVSGFRLNLLGRHNVYNALAAAAVAFVLGVGTRTIAKALSGYRPTYMRLDPIRINGIDVINDSYNSNPLSLKMALEAIKDHPARARWVVSGDMLELGKGAVRFHEAAGKLIAGSAVEGLFTFGELSKHTLSRAMQCGMNKNNLRHCATHNEIADILKKVAKKGDVILVKGSRSMMMEKVIEKFKG
jgi:UDP-N-acetylmuramyl pentapeptide synthase